VVAGCVAGEAEAEGRLVGHRSIYCGGPAQCASSQAPAASGRRPPGAKALQGAGGAPRAAHLHLLQQPAPRRGRHLHREYAATVDLELGASDGGDAGALVVAVDGHRGDLNKQGDYLRDGPLLWPRAAALPLSRPAARWASATGQHGGHSRNRPGDSSRPTHPVDSGGVGVGDSEGRHLCGLIGRHAVQLGQVPSHHRNACGVDSRHNDA
jgi:hypothetical protein